LIAHSLLAVIAVQRDIAAVDAEALRGQTPMLAKLNLYGKNSKLGAAVFFAMLTSSGRQTRMVFFLDQILRRAALLVTDMPTGAQVDQHLDAGAVMDALIAPRHGVQRRFALLVLGVDVQAVLAPIAQQAAGVVVDPGPLVDEVMQR
jgi:hypothetical protein